MTNKSITLQLPDWVSRITQDKAGPIWLWNSDPYILEDRNCFSSMGRAKPIHHGTINENWRDSKINLNTHSAYIDSDGILHRADLKTEQTIIVLGQIFKHPNYGMVKFKILDYYHGECTVELEGIEFPGTYYPKIELMMELGFTIVDK